MEISEIINNSIKILKAFNDGKVIEHLYGGKWYKINSLYSILTYLAEDKVLRIKPEPVYRPYANAEEFSKASKEHGPYVKVVGKYRTVTFNNSGVKWAEQRLGACEYSYEQLLDNGEWQDRTRCGILE